MSQTVPDATSFTFWIGPFQEPPEGKANRNESEWKTRTWKAQKKELKDGVMIAAGSVFIIALSIVALHTIHIPPHQILLSKICTGALITGIAGGVIGGVIGLMKAYRYKQGKMTSEQVSMFRNLVMNKDGYQYPGCKDLFNKEMDNWLAYGMVSEDLAAEMKEYQRLADRYDRVEFVGWNFTPTPQLTEVYIPRSEDDPLVIQNKPKMEQLWASMTAKFSDPSHLAVLPEDTIQNNNL